MDAVGFVVQSALARLTASQTYIFNSVLSIFGKDIEENVRFMVTFADGRKPLVLAAIKEAKLPCRMANGIPCHQSFNNGAVYISNKSSDDRLSPIEFEQGMKNFKSFFTDLSKMPVKSLKMTQEVLISRESLQITIAGLESTIQVHLHKMEELRKIEEEITRHKDQVDANKDFEIKVDVNKKQKVPVCEGTAMNCQKCETTCHYPCDPHLWTGFCPAFWRPINLTIGGLLSTSFGGFRCCKVCPGKCESEDHSNEEEQWSYVLTTETKTLYEVRKKYEDALQQKLTATQLKDALEAEVEQLKHDIVKAIQTITHCSNLLKKIALRGDPLTTPEYIQFMIENEKKEKKPKYMERIKNLEDLLRKAERIKDIVDGNEIIKQFFVE